MVSALWYTVLGDSLSLIMVTTASFVITLIMAYGFGRGEHKANRYHFAIVHIIFKRWRDRLFSNIRFI